MRKSYPLTGRLWVGLKGAGIAPWLKPKVLSTITFTFNGQKFTVGNSHGPASTYIPIRHRIAKRYFRRMARRIKRIDGLFALTGDFNATPSSRLLVPLRNVGVRSSQAVLGVIGTHGHRAIDDVKFRYAPKRMKVVRNRDHRAPSDHDYYGVDIDVVSP